MARSANLWRRRWGGQVGVGRRLIVCGVGALSFGCRPIQAPAIPAATTPSPVVPNTTGPWDIDLRHEVYYKIYIDAFIVSRYVDSLPIFKPVVDSVSTMATVRWTDRSGSIWNGQLVGFETTIGGRKTVLATGTTGGPVGGPTLPIPLRFSSRSVEGPWIRTAPEEATCSAASAMAAVAREVVLPVPARLRRDAIWQDSSTIMTCRDSIPLEVTSVRRYRVLEAVAVDDDVQLRIERVTTTRMRGTGRQLGEPVTITGTGRGTMRFTLARRDGFIVTGEGEQQLELRLEGRRRTQEVRQTTQITVRRP